MTLSNHLTMTILSIMRNRPPIPTLLVFNLMFILGVYLSSCTNPTLQFQPCNAPLLDFSLQSYTKDCPPGLQMCEKLQLRHFRGSPEQPNLLVLTFFSHENINVLKILHTFKQQLITKQSTAHSRQNIHFIAINTDTPNYERTQSFNTWEVGADPTYFIRESIQSFVSTQGIGDPIILMDPGGAYFHRLCATYSQLIPHTPLLLLIDNMGAIRFFCDPNQIEHLSLLENGIEWLQQEQQRICDRENTLHLFISGFLRGQLVVDQGGIAHLSGALDEFKSRYPNGLALMAGNFMPNYPDYQRSETVFRCLQAMEFDVISPGRYDLLQDLPTIVQSEGSLPLLLPIGVRPRHATISDLGAVHRVILKQGSIRVGIVVLMDPRGLSYYSNPSNRGIIPRFRMEKSVEQSLKQALKKPLEDLINHTDQQWVITHVPSDPSALYQFEKELIEYYPQLDLVLATWDNYETPFLATPLQIDSSYLVTLDSATTGSEHQADYLILHATIHSDHQIHQLILDYGIVTNDYPVIPAVHSLILNYRNQTAPIKPRQNTPPDPSLPTTPAVEGMRYYPSGDNAHE